jgi:hypothetical protein
MIEDKKDTNPLTVKVAKTTKEGIKQPTAVKVGLIPKLHCSWILSGASGSGKTNSLIHMFNTPQLLKGVFHRIVYFIGSPDDSVSLNLKIPEKDIVRDFDENKIKEILDSQKKLVDTMGFAKASEKHNTAFIFDDILSQPKFLNSPTILKLVTEARHYLVSNFFCTQSYKKLPRTVRINAKAILFFPASLGEVIKFCEENALPNMSTKKFMEMVQYATKEQYNFAFLQKDAKIQEQLRKNFDTILMSE